MSTTATEARIASRDIAVAIAARGMEVTSVRDRDGHEWIWQRLPLWLKQGPLLFPVVGTSAGGQVRWQGRSYPMAIHGFAPASDFALAESHADSCRFTLAASPETMAIYPFAFALDVHFAVSGATLRETVTVRNVGKEPMPMQVGLHPGFTLPAGDANPIIVLDRDEATQIRQIRDGALAGPMASPLDGRVFRLTPDTFAGGAILFDQVRSGSVWYGRPGGRGVAFAIEGFPSLAFWNKPPGPYLCIEPWHGLPEPENFTGSLAERPGTTLLQPGGAVTVAAAMTFGAPQPG
jgi:galactose mutarotase-like enzyme